MTSESRLPKWARELLEVERTKVEALQRFIESAVRLARFDVEDSRNGQIEVRQMDNRLRIVGDRPLVIELNASNVLYIGLSGDK